MSAKLREEFDHRGIATTDRARRVSRRVTAWAIEAFIRKLYPHVKPDHIAIAGSHANDEKSPRMGLYPADMTHLDALSAEVLKRYHRYVYPSDVDVVGIHLDTNSRMDAVIRAEKQIFRTHRILIGVPFVSKDRKMKGPTAPVRSTITKLITK